MENKFFYSATKGEFVNSVSNGREKKDIFDKMETASVEAGVTCGDSEKKSWMSNFEALSSLVCKSHLPDDVMIAFECKMPVGGCRVDCMLFGEGEDNAYNVVHIELKQWTNGNVNKYYDHHTFKVIVDGYSHGAVYTSHPSEQVAGYQDCMLNYMKCFENGKLQLTGLAYCYEYVADTKSCVLQDEYYKPITDEYPLFCKGQEVELSQMLHRLLCKGHGKDMKDIFSNSEIGPTQRLHDMAASMLDSKEAEKIFALVGDQVDTYKAILGAVKNTKQDQKTVIIVKGGPGTGKSVIAMKLLSELYKPEYMCNNVYYATNSSTLRNGLKNELKKITHKYGKGSACDLIQSCYDFKPYRYDFKENGGDVLIVDEAHRIANQSNHKTDSHRDEKDRSNLTQIMSLLYTSRVCVFFIDDKQSILDSEIGLSSEIRKAAENYKSRIEEENRKYQEIDLKKSQKKLDTQRKELGNAIQNGNEDKIAKKKKLIRKLERECNRPLVWPQIENVNILEFELIDQFRCNGSNNYLQWIDNVIYNDEKTPNVKLSGDYEFAIVDTPQELVAKIRSLDSYAVFSDKKEKELVVCKV